jgi:hypothetical protein
MHIWIHRYETGVIQPPMYCGTVHVSPLGPGDMDGGDFAVHSGGLDHYKKHGYKGILCYNTKPSVYSYSVIQIFYYRGLTYQASCPLAMLCRKSWRRACKAEAASGC